MINTKYHSAEQVRQEVERVYTPPKKRSGKDPIWIVLLFVVMIIVSVASCIYMLATMPPMTIVICMLSVILVRTWNRS